MDSSTRTNETNLVNHWNLYFNQLDDIKLISPSKKEKKDIYFPG